MEDPTMSNIKFWSDMILSVTSVITLVFLAIQTKRSNRIAKVQAQQNRYQLFLEMDKIIIDNPELKKLISNSFFEKNYGRKFDNGEAKELAFIEMVVNICQLSFYQSRHNLNDNELNWIKELFKNDYIKEYWYGKYRCTYSLDFEKWIDQII